MIIGQHMTKEELEQNYKWFFTFHFSCKTVEMFSMGEQSKSKHKFGGTKVCEADEVKGYFINPKTENKNFV